MSDNGKLCRKTSGSHYSYIIMENTIGMKEHHLEIQIDNIGYVVGFGMTTLGAIKSKNFTDYNSLSQTYSILSSKKVYARGSTYEHGLNLNVGDSVMVEVIDGKIIFYKKN